MILEHAVLSVRKGEEGAFEAAIRDALPLIAATEGFVSLEVKPCIETAGQYLLLVQWRFLEDHTQGFRNSDRYAEWQRRLHHFYEPFPRVEHYGEAIASA